MRRTRLAFLGDVMLGRLVNEEVARRPPESFWGSLLPVLRQADAVLANLECAVTTHTRPWTETPKVFHFRAEPAAVEVLRVGNVRYVSLANNHTLDFEATGLRDTLGHLDAAGIAHAGAGATLAEATAPVLFEIAGLRVAALSLTDNEPAFAAGPDRPGVYFSEIGTGPEVLDPIRSAVAGMRAQGADIFVLSAHWGPNMVVSPSRRFRSFARAVTDLGVDLVHGHSAHVFQGVERRDGRLVLYDTGDALDDYAVDPALRNDWSFVFLLDLEDGRPRRLLLRPLRLTFARVDLAVGAEFEAIRARMEELSAEFGTSYVRTGDGLELTLDA